MKKVFITAVAVGLITGCASQFIPVKDGGEGVYYAESPPQHIYVHSYGWPYYYGFYGYPYYYPWWLNAYGRYDHWCYTYPGCYSPLRYPTYAYAARRKGVYPAIGTGVLLPGSAVDSRVPANLNKGTLVQSSQLKQRRSIDPMRLKPVSSATRGDTGAGRRTMRVPSTRFERPTRSVDRTVSPSPHRSRSPDID